MCIKLRGLLLILLVAGTGCRGKQAAETLNVNVHSAPLTTDNGAEIRFLGTWGNPLGALVPFWGTADLGGRPMRIHQTLYWEQDPHRSIRVQFDGQSLPIRLEREENGAFVLIFWEAERAVFKLYQPDGSYVGGAAVTAKGNDFEAAQLADSAVVGYFSGTLAGLTDAIVTFTVGGVATGEAPGPLSGAGAQRRALDEASSLSDVEAAQAKGMIDALAGPATQGQPEFAQRLLTSVSDAFATSRRSDLGQRIFETALRGTAVSPMFLDGEPSLLGGLTSLNLLGKVAQRISQRLSQGQTPLQDGTVGAAARSPSPADYRSSVTYKTTRPAGDSTGVRGIVASRELGTVSVVGLIDSSGALFMSGTSATGDVIELRGTVSDGQVLNGHWEIVATDPSPGDAGTALRALDSGPSNGDWNAGQQPLGNCSQQQNSGGQGIFSNTYDLGKCGVFPFSYEAYSIPDQFQIFQDSIPIFDTGGQVSGGSTVNVAAVGQTTLIRVVVTASNEGTLWDYTVGCPQ